MEPEFYFVPPYVGPKGWLGVELNTGLRWKTIAMRVREAYLEVAPAPLDREAETALVVPQSVTALRPEEVDPFLRPRARKILKQLAALCLSLPETEPGTQFGNPVWKAGKKTFCTTHHRQGRLQLSFRVGGEQQALLTLDSRFSIPAYTGHNGWVDLDVEDQTDWQEIEQLALLSYRHFALKRMLKALDAADR
jgi:predicted DNA-binding protein (MmcQ/YjbR family)